MQNKIHYNFKCESNTVGHLIGNDLKRQHAMVVLVDKVTKKFMQISLSYFSKFT